MKISESEVILIVVLVLIGFVLYTQTGGAMKTTSIKKVGGKHDVQEEYGSEHDYFQANKNWKQDFMCFETSNCRDIETKWGIDPYTLSCGLWMSKTAADQFTSNKNWDIPIKIYGGDTSRVQVLDGICRKEGGINY